MPNISSWKVSAHGYHIKRRIPGPEYQTPVCRRLWRLADGADSREYRHGAGVPGNRTDSEAASGSIQQPAKMH